MSLSVDRPNADRLEHLTLVPMTVMAKSAKIHPASKKICGWEEPVIWHPVKMAPETNVAGTNVSWTNVILTVVYL